MNLRRKCDGFIFQTGYGRGIENTTDAISRIKGWSKEDPDRLESVEDSRDIDDDSNEVNITDCINSSDLENMILEVNSMNLDEKDNINNKASLTSAILGSWHSTPRPIQLSTLLKMYGNVGWDSDNHAFDKEIYNLDAERTKVYSSKIDMADNL